MEERGTVKLEYEIFKSDGDVCHGFWSGDSVSFIRYDTIKEAQMSKSHLQTFSTAEFVNPKMVISETNVWLVVQKIDSTLDQFKKKNTGIWSCDDLLDDKYKTIVRDIIAGVIQLANQRYLGKLKIRDIAIINGRAKFMRISNELGVGKLSDQLQNLLKELLGIDPNNKELTDFYSHMKTMPMKRMRKANRKLLEVINMSGRVFMTHAVVEGVYVIRFAVGATLVEERHVNTAWEMMQKHADFILST
ncbi:tyrosine/dopa decarboxylase 5 [Quercus suber]|uniref:Tyrosine/dopa decarboxylase 5 n=1 Tax=Quercus suber TaxID=58331 RepID=A0AAW0KYW9_QUESU